MKFIQDYTQEEELKFYKTIIKALPQSMILLDKDKNIIGIFNLSLKILAGKSVDDILGTNILMYANDPTSPFHQACSMLNDAFESVSTTGVPVKYHFKILDNYLESTISKLSDGQILNEIRDITDIVIKRNQIETKEYGKLENTAESWLLQQKYESLYNQMTTIVNTLPVGVEIYSPDGKMQFLNDTDFKIFGIPKETFDISGVNINGNPNLPDKVKKVVMEGGDIRCSFPYSFETVKDSSYYTTAQDGNIHIECIGRPITDARGQLENYLFIVQNVTETVRATRQLEEKKQLQDNILNSIPACIQIKDIEDNSRYVFCNDESQRLFGISVDKTIHDVMEAKRVSRIEKTDKEVFATGNPYNGLEHIELKDGRSFDTLVRKSVIFDSGKRMLLTVRWDQSLQNDLKRRTKMLDLSMEIMNAHTWFYEPDKDQFSFGEGSNNLIINPVLHDSLKKFISFVHPDDRKLFLDSFRHAITHENEKWNVEYRADLNNNGTYNWWQTQGLVETTQRDEGPYTFMFGMTISIDKHKQNELTMMRENEKKLNGLIQQNELILNNTYSGLVYITTDYIVQWENVANCSASLTYEAYKKGSHCYESYGLTSPCEDCVMQQAILSRQTEQMQNTFENGHTLEIFCTPVFKEDGTADGIVIRMDDVTERENMIQELKHAKTLAEQSDKLKSAFLANMSHEIRTPLNAIVGFSDLLMETTEPEEKAEYIKIININNELLLKLISDILDLSKIESGTVELKYDKFDISTYFEDLVISMKQRITNSYVRLLSHNPYPDCKVNLDRNRVTQIITNYVTNAIKYTPKGFIEMGYEVVENGIRLYVRDSGIGIPDEKKNKLFQRFEKLDEFAQGTGLGLSICKAIAEAMGGNVGFESTFGQGSLFWAFLPCETEIHQEKQLQTEKKAVPVSNKSSISNERKTILIAEDIESNYLLVSTILKKDYDLIRAKNGQEAMDIIKSQPIDLLLIDMKMPIMNGLIATEKIRQFNTKLPIIALTAHAFDADRQAALTAGCNEYLMKPIDKTKLFDILQEFL